MDQISNKKSNRFFSISMFDDIYTHPVQLFNEFDWFIHSIQMMIIDLINRWFVCEFANVYEFQSNFNLQNIIIIYKWKKCFCEGCYCKIEIMLFMDDDDENHRCFQISMIFSKLKVFLCFSIASEFDFFWLSFYMMFFSMMENIFLNWIFFFFQKKSLNKFRDF